MSYERNYETEQEEKRCAHCDATTVTYTHNLGKGLCAGLKALSFYLHATHLDELNLTYNQRANFPKLQYWGLVGRGANSGTWYITDMGREFVSGKIAVLQRAKSYRGKTQEQFGPPVHFKDIDAYNVTDPAIVNYPKRGDYAESAEAHNIN
jgi:hypothetical protein